jgi:ribosome-binding factor A
VQELLVHEISQIIRRELRDPDVGFVTITDAEVTPDLRHARIYFSVLGDEAQRAKSGKSLNRAAGFLRSQFAQRAQLRYVPDLRFEYDVAVDRGARISELLEQVRRDDEQAASSTDTGSHDDTGSD